MDSAREAVKAAAEAFFGVPVNLSGTRNLEERLVRIAEATREPIATLDVAAFLIASGISKSTIKNLRPHVYNALNDHPDFEKAGEGLFTYEKLSKLSSSSC